MSARRRWGWPLVPAYGAALAAKDALRAAGLVPTRRLRWPVISVGSISAGGAGKTPATIALARLLQDRGWLVDVLSRGYGRGGKGVEKVDAGRPDAAHRFGDEPLLIAQETDVPVWVGANRFAAGRRAEDEVCATAKGYASTPGGQETRECAHLLDDGFQHRALHRDFDLVLVTEDDLRDALLPAGNLREPLSALRRADAFAVREGEVERVSGHLRRLGRPEVPLWTLRRSLRFPAPYGVFGAGLRPLAFCGIARPENFAAMLDNAGCGIVDTVIFPDHHRYDEDDLRSLMRMASQLNATGLVTTEKDAVKLPDEMRKRLTNEIGPLMVVRLEASFVFESPVVRTLQQRLRTPAAGENALEARVR